MNLSPAAIKKLVKSRKRPPFHNGINLWSVLDQAAVGVDLQMSAVLELVDHPDIALKDNGEVEIYLNQVRKLLHSIPEGTTVQFLIQSRKGGSDQLREFFDQAAERRNLGSLEKTILKAKEQFIKDKFVQNRRFFLCVTTYADNVPPTSIPTIGLYSPIEKKTTSLTRAMHQARMKQLNAIAESISDSLLGLRVTAKRLSDRELSALFFQHLNPSSSKVIPCPDLEQMCVKSGYSSARSMLALSASSSEFDHFAIDGVHHKAVNLLHLPEVTNPNDIVNLLNDLWPDFDLCLTVHCVNSEQMIEKMKRATNVAKALSFSNFGSRYEAEQKFTDLDEFIREIRSTSQKVFTFSFCLLFKDRDLSQLEANVSIGLKSFQELNSAIGIVDNMNHDDLFLSVLPNHSHLNPRRHAIHTNAFANLIPLSASWKGSKRPKALFENPQGELVNMDLFDPCLPSKHSFLIGSTGSGKSFTTNYLLTNFLIESENNHIVIIDIGGSYRKVCQLFGGQYLSVDLSDKFAFNPFPEKKAVFDGSDYDKDTLAYLTLILERMILDEGEKLNPVGEMILERTIKHAYEKTEGDRAPLLEDIHAGLSLIEGDEETKALARHYANNLEIWVRGRYAKIFNSPKKLQVNNRLIVFDLEQLSHHPRLQSVYFYVIREIIDGKLKAKALKKMIVIDEGWRFFNDEIGSRLIENLYRTARKSNGMILSISQSPVDFLSTHAANAIISNTYVKYVLKLTKGHDVLPQFGFNSAEIEAIKNLASVPRKFSDVFLKFDSQATVLRIEPSSLDYWICTTDAEDSVKESRLRNQHPDWTDLQILQALADEAEHKENKR